MKKTCFQERQEIEYN